LYKQDTIILTWHLKWSCLGQNCWFVKWSNSRPGRDWKLLFYITGPACSPQIPICVQPPLMAASLLPLGKPSLHVRLHTLSPALPSLRVANAAHGLSSSQGQQTSCIQVFVHKLPLPSPVFPFNIASRGHFLCRAHPGHLSFTDHLSSFGLCQW
jgi:hypothetical protein